MSLSLAYLILAAGLLLLIAEMFIPTGGLFFVLSMGAIVVAVTMTFLYSDDPTLGILTLTGVCLAIPAILGLMVHYWPRTRFGKRFFLNSPLEDETIATMPVNLELESLRGRYGRTVSALRPSGITDFDGRYVDTMSEGMMIEPNQWVRCIEVKTGKVIVRVVDKPDLGRLESIDFT